VCEGLAPGCSHRNCSHDAGSHPFADAAADADAAAASAAGTCRCWPQLAPSSCRSRRSTTVHRRPACRHSSLAAASQRRGRRFSPPTPVCSPRCARLPARAASWRARARRSCTWLPRCRQRPTSATPWVSAGLSGRGGTDAVSGRERCPTACTGPFCCRRSCSARSQHQRPRSACLPPLPLKPACCRSTRSRCRPSSALLDTSVSRPSGPAPCLRPARGCAATSSAAARWSLSRSGWCRAWAPLLPALQQRTPAGARPTAAAASAAAAAQAHTRTASRRACRAPAADPRAAHLCLRASHPAACLRAASTCSMAAAPQLPASWCSAACVSTLRRHRQPWRAQRVQRRRPPPLRPRPRLCATARAGARAAAATHSGCRGRCLPAAATRRTRARRPRARRRAATAAAASGRARGGAPARSPRPTSCTTPTSR
jgi:hypothetical protein